MNKLEAIKKLLKEDKITKKCFTKEILDLFREQKVGKNFYTWDEYGELSFLVNKNLLPKKVIKEVEHRIYEKYKPCNVKLNEFDDKYYFHIEEIRFEEDEEVISKIRKIIRKVKNVLKVIPKDVLNDDIVENIIKDNLS